MSGICGRVSSLACLHYLSKLPLPHNVFRLSLSVSALRMLISPCTQSTPDSVVERELGRQARERRPSPMPLPPTPPPPGPSNGELWWRRALEMHTGNVGVFSQTIPWEALCKHSLAAYFLQTLGDEGRDRPLLVSKRRSFLLLQHEGRRSVPCGSTRL